MTTFEDQIKVFSSAQRLNTELKSSQKDLMDQLCVNTTRQITQYYELIKQKIMTEFETELDVLIKASKDLMATDMSCTDKVFKLTGTFPKV